MLELGIAVQINEGDFEVDLESHAKISIGMHGSVDLKVQNRTLLLARENYDCRA